MTQEDKKRIEKIRTTANIALNWDHVGFLLTQLDEAHEALRLAGKRLQSLYDLTAYPDESDE